MSDTYGITSTERSKILIIGIWGLIVPIVSIFGTTTYYFQRNMLSEFHEDNLHIDPYIWCKVNQKFKNSYIRYEGKYWPNFTNFISHRFTEIFCKRPAIDTGSSYSVLGYLNVVVHRQILHVRCRSSIIHHQFAVLWLLSFF